MFKLKLSPMPDTLKGNPLETAVSKALMKIPQESDRIGDYIAQLSHNLFQELSGRDVENYLKQAGLPYIETANQAINLCCDYRFEYGLISVQRGMTVAIQRTLAEHILYRHFDKTVTRQDFADTIGEILKSGTFYATLAKVLKTVSGYCII